MVKPRPTVPPKAKMDSKAGDRKSPSAQRGNITCMLIHAMEATANAANRPSFVYDVSIYDAPNIATTSSDKVIAVSLGIFPCPFRSSVVARRKELVATAAHAVPAVAKAKPEIPSATAPNAKIGPANLTILSAAGLCHMMGTN